MRRILSLLIAMMLFQITVFANVNTYYEMKSKLTIDCNDVVGDVKYSLAGASIGGNTHSFDKEEVRNVVTGIVPVVRLEEVGGPGQGIYDPSVGKYNFDRLFDEIDKARGTGAELIADVFTMPKWLSADPDGEFWFNPPRDYAQWQTYVKEIVRNVNIENNGKRRIEYWEIWNEPSGGYFYKGYKEKGNFPEFYSKTAEAIKLADPTAKVGGYADNPYYQDFRAWAEYQVAHNTVPDFLTLHHYGEWLPDGAEHPRYYLDFASQISNNVKDIIGKQLPVIYTEWNLNAEQSKYTRDMTVSFASQALYWMQTGNGIINPVEKACFFRIEEYGKTQGAILNKDFQLMAPGRVLLMFQALQAKQLKTNLLNDGSTALATTNDSKDRITTMLSRHDMSGRIKDNTADITIKNHNIEGNYTVRVYVEDITTRDNTGGLYPIMIQTGNVEAGEPIVLPTQSLKNYSAVLIDIYSDPNGNRYPLPSKSIQNGSQNELTLTKYSFDDISETGAVVDGVHGGIDFGTGSWKSDEMREQLNKCVYFADDATSKTFTLPKNNILKKLTLGGSINTKGTKCSIRSTGNSEIKLTVSEMPQTVETNWIKGSELVTISFTGGTSGAIDDIYYELAFDPKPGDNLVQNSSFENGTLGGFGVGGVVKSNAHSGNNAMVMQPGNWSFRTIGGLTANTEYIFKAWVKNASATDRSYAGFKGHGYNEWYLPVDGTGYQLVKNRFTTGLSSTSVTIFFGKNEGTDASYADDFEVRQVVEGMDDSEDTSEEDTLESTNTEVRFNDIKSHWANIAIEYVAGKGLMNGLTEDRFAPDITITRAEFIALMARVADLGSVDYNGQFEDITADDWYADSIQSAYNNGLIDEGMLRGKAVLPNNDISREEAASLLVKTYYRMKSINDLKVEDSAFVDSDKISNWAIEYVNIAAQIELIKGKTPSKFDPQNDLTRAEAAVILKRLIDKK